MHIDMQNFLKVAEKPPLATISATRWRAFRSAGIRFISNQWLQRAEALGWPQVAIFGGHPTHPCARYDCAGLIWSLAVPDRHMVALDEFIATIGTWSGGRLRYDRRMQAAEAVMLF